MMWTAEGTLTFLTLMKVCRKKDKTPHVLPSCSSFFLMFPGYYSVTIVNQFSLCLVSIEAGLNLVEGDIVLDVVC